MTVADRTSFAGVGPAFPDSARARLARSLATAVDAVAGVRRCGGSGIEVSTQYRGGRIIGVRLADHEVTVQVVAERLPLEPLADQVRAAARAVLHASDDDRPVQVVVDDLDLTSLPRTAP